MTDKRHIVIPDADKEMTDLLTGERLARLEEMLPLFAGDDVPIAVVDDSGRFLGSVSRETAINALARPAG